jgi:Lrp/AsnC family transcriptional regulator for asnA, asnC and gidA
MEDGRRPFREIARSLDVPESTVRFRANRLLREGVLNIVAMASPHRLGYEVLAIILLRVRPRARAGAIEALKALPEVQYLSSAAGRADLALQVVCRDHGDLRRLLAERFPAIPGILETETLVELEVHKFKYAYPGLGGEPPARGG